METYMDNNWNTDFLHYVTLICTVLACTPHLSKPEHIAIPYLSIEADAAFVPPVKVGPISRRLGAVTWLIDTCCYRNSRSWLIYVFNSGYQLVTSSNTHQTLCWFLRCLWLGWRSASHVALVIHVHVSIAWITHTFWLGIWALSMDGGFKIYLDKIAGNKTLEYLGKTTLEWLVTTSVY